jgi:hypothetical protein
MHEKTGVQHSDRCQAETEVLRALVNAMKAQGAPRVGDLDQTGTLEGLLADGRVSAAVGVLLDDGEDAIWDFAKAANMADELIERERLRR